MEDAKLKGLEICHPQVSWNPLIPPYWMSHFISSVFTMCVYNPGEEHLQSDIRGFPDEEGVWAGLGQCLCICVGSSSILIFSRNLLSDRSTSRLLMRFHCCICHSGCRPVLVAVDDIMFRKPVEIGSLLLLSSQVRFWRKKKTSMWENNKRLASLMKPSYCYHLELDWFPMTACPEVFYNSYTSL